MSVPGKNASIRLILLLFAVRSQFVSNSNYLLTNFILYLELYIVPYGVHACHQFIEPLLSISCEIMNN